MLLADKHLNLALALYQHRELGVTIGAYLIRAINDDTYIIEKNVIVDPGCLISDRNSDEQVEIIRYIQEVSEKSLLKLFGRNTKTFSELLQKVQEDEQLNGYIRNYIDRRISKAIDLATTLNIPIFLRDKNARNLYRERMLEFKQEPAQPVFRFELYENGIRYSLKIVHSGATISLNPNNLDVLTIEPCLLKISGTIYKVDGIDGRKFLPYTKKEYVLIPQQSVQKYMETFILNTIRNNHVEAVGFDVLEEHSRPKPVLILDERLAGGACLSLNFQYGKKMVASNSSPISEVKLTHKKDHYSFVKYSRSAEREEKIKQSLFKKWKLNKTGENEFSPDRIENDGFNHYRVVEWLNRHYHELINDGFEIIQRYQQVTFHLSGFNLNIKINDGIDWFDLNGQVQIGNFSIPFAYFKKHIIKNIHEFTLPNGTVFILPDEWFAKYRTIMLLGKEEDGHIRLSKAAASLLYQTGITGLSTSDITERVKKIEVKDIDIPKSLNAQLRKYQIIGYAWLKTLTENGLNGCLADDMGLGKTLQTITLLLSNYEKNNFSKGEGKTSLVITPTSIIYNWQNEFSRFAPFLKVGVYHGSQRDKSLKPFLQHHVIITSYGTIRNDIELFKNFNFNYVVLDESQTIKNPASKTYRCALLLKYQKTLCLSGTPIENNLFDLWAQMNFLNRGMLGGLKMFREEFAVPIERKNDTEKHKLLKRIIEPLIFRRTKEEVARELPPLTEQVIYCEMTDEQSKAYETEKSKARRLIIENFEQVSDKTSNMNVLSALSRLRQLANHPAMLEDYPTLSSGKFEEVTLMIDSVLSENHKILIFSSFVKHLIQVENYLKESAIGYEMLTGSTVNRSDVVEEFQNNPEKKVFLISLKAGGVGLNLTAADYIFILDPWWNPAAEMQAASRAHRIGQTKNVFVYRFITRNTVEEKILKLQAHKENLAHEFVNTNNPMVLMNKEQLLNLVE